MPTDTAATMTIVINGQPRAISAPATIACLLAAHRPRPPFAVEHNGSLVRRPDYARTPLGEGDRIEIVTLVGGG